MRHAWHDSHVQNETYTQAMFTLEDLDTLWNWIWDLWSKVWSRIEYILKWSSLSTPDKVNEVKVNIKWILDQLWLNFSEVYVSSWDFDGKTLDQVFNILSAK